MELLSRMMFAVNDTMGLECDTVFSKIAALISNYMHKD